MRYLLMFVFLSFGVKASAQSRVSIDELKIYSHVDQMPVFPGDTVEKYIQHNVKYPDHSRKEGVCWVKFIVNPDGSVSDAEVTKSLGKDFDAESLRVIRTMPKWQAGVNKGTAVKVWMKEPVRFKQ